MQLIDRTTPPSPRDAAWAKKHLSHLPTLICCTATERRAETWYDEDGRGWRRGGVIVAAPHTPDGRFRIHLWAGATDKDLEYLQHVIGEAKTGHFTSHGWIREESPTGVVVYRYQFSYPAPIQAQPLEACGVAGCVDVVHLAPIDDETLHRATPAGHEGWGIEIARVERDPWRLFIDRTPTNLAGEAAPDDARQFALKLAEAADFVERLNALVAS